MSKRLGLLPNSKRKRLIAVEERLEIKEVTLTIVVHKSHLRFAERARALWPRISCNNPK